jgi:adiponectin receptor
MREHDVLGRVGPQHGWSEGSLLAVRDSVWILRSWQSLNSLVRSVIFIMLGASGFAPIIHVFVSDHMSLANFPLVYIFASSVLYLVGTAFYVSRTPEKHWPGMFNVWVSESILGLFGDLLTVICQGASHQIFHILINIAQISHLLGLWTALLTHY